MADLVITSDWRERLSRQDRASLGEAGFVHLRAVASQAEVEAMRAAWARAMEVSPPRGHNDGPGGLQDDPAFRPCVEHPEVMSAVAQLLDGDVVLMGFRGREPRQDSGQQGLHVDDSGPAERGRQRIANAFWMLDDMDESNGATLVVPGSHRLGRIPGREFLSQHAKHPEAKALKAAAGDVIVFSAHLWHAGSKNVSGARRRIAMAMFGRREVVRSYVEAYDRSA